MTIKDIKFLNNEAYMLKDLSLSLHECEEQMRKIDYDGFYDAYRHCKDENGVEKTQFPSIIYSFYSIVFNSNRIPEPRELLEAYYILNSKELSVKEGIVIYKNRSFKKADLDARILRTYPSLIRDYHFYLMLVETACFDKVIYSCKNDVNGIDITIVHNDKKYVLSLFVKTSRSTHYKAIKNTYRHDYDENEIQLPLDLMNANKCGDFFVYDKQHLRKVQEAILN